MRTSARCCLIQLARIDLLVTFGARLVVPILASSSFSSAARRHTGPDVSRGPPSNNPMLLRCSDMFRDIGFLRALPRWLAVRRPGMTFESCSSGRAADVHCVSGQLWGTEAIWASHATAGAVQCWCSVGAPLVLRWKLAGLWALRVVLRPFCDRTVLVLCWYCFGFVLVCSGTALKLYRYSVDVLLLC